MIRRIITALRTLFAGRPAVRGIDGERYRTGRGRRREDWYL